MNIVLKSSCVSTIDLEEVVNLNNENEFIRKAQSESSLSFSFRKFQTTFISIFIIILKTVKTIPISRIY